MKVLKSTARVFLIIVCGTLLVYFGSVVFRSLRTYGAVKGKHYGERGKERRPDLVLGYRHIPGARTVMRVRGARDIPLIYDGNGFRVPAGTPAAAPHRGPLVLALGCSYTYGYLCNAEQAYPYLVGRALGGDSINAGVCGHGLAHMLILARRLIPEFKPDFVLAQYSPFLADRAIVPVYITPYGKIPVPVPYFSMRDGRPALQPPAFPTRFFDAPIWDYLETPASTRDFFSYLTRVGLPLFTYSDHKMTGYLFAKGLGSLPPPALASEKNHIIRLVYSEIMDVCRKNGARLIIVEMESGDNISLPGAAALKDIRDAVIVDANSTLLERLQEKSFRAYRREYGSVIGDGHPNPLAHRIIAAEIVTAVRGM